jgi:hypothetical protein
VKKKPNKKMSTLAKEPAKYGPSGFGKRGTGSTGFGFNKADAGKFTKESKSKTFNPTGGSDEARTGGRYGSPTTPKAKPGPTTPKKI